MTDYSAAEKYQDYTDRVRVRPNPKANRPRSKQRPSHADAVTGKVIEVSRGRYTAIVAEGAATERRVVCARARELRKQPIVIGDSVQIAGDTSGGEGTLGRIVRVNDRKTVLMRSADDSDTVERVMVANATQMLIVVAAANPEPRTGLVDRSLVAAYNAGITPLLCVTKTDLRDPTEFLEHYAGLDIPVFKAAMGRVPIAELTRQLAGHTTVFIGHSGVGKSTLINTLVPEAARATGRVNDVTGRGRHTSSSSVALRLESAGEPGWVIDTPGVRSFGLGHVSESAVLGAFPDLAAVLEQCPRGCLHAAVNSDCELSAAAAAGELNGEQRARLESLRNLLDGVRAGS